MRSIDTSMQAALAASTRRPAISLLIEDQTIHLSSYQTPGLTDQLSDCCLASDGSIIRVNLTRGSFSANFQYTRITDPSIAAQWSSVTSFSGGSGTMFQDGGCCVSNTGGTLRAFAQRGTGGNNIYCWTSSDNGATWSGPSTVVSPPSSALTKGMSSAGNNDLFFIYDVSGGDDLGACFYSSGSWSSISNWGQPHLNYGAGLAVTWTGSQYNIAYTDSYTLGSASYKSGTWTLNPAIAPATSTAIGRQAPRLSIYNNLYHLIVNESDTGSISGAVYSYCRVRESADFIHWSDGWILHEISTTYGGNLFYLAAPASGSSGARYYFVCPASVLSTSVFSTSNPNQYLDLSGSVLSYQRIEKLNKPAQLVVTIDNRGGNYNSLINLSGGSSYRPITPGALMKLSEGYLAGTAPGTPDTVLTGTYRLAEIEIQRSPQENQIKLIGIDYSYVLDRIARWQNSYTGQSLQYMLLEVCARAGIFNPNISANSQLSQSIPSFLIQAAQSYRVALDSLCATYGLDSFLDQSETLQIREVQASDPSIWSYQPEIELLSFNSNYERANHIIVSGRPPSGIAYGLTTSEAYDDTANQATRIERVLHHTDLKLTSTSQTSLAASLTLYTQQRAQTVHSIVVPLNPALQLIDCLTVTDSAAPTGSGQSSIARIIAHTASFDAQRAEYESHLSLQGR